MDGPSASLAIASLWKRAVKTGNFSRYHPTVRKQKKQMAPEMAVVIFISRDLISKMSKKTSHFPRHLPH